MLQEFIQDQPSPVAICQERERIPRFPEQLCAKNDLLTYFSKNTTLIVKLLRNSTG